MPINPGDIVSCSCEGLKCTIVMFVESVDEVEGEITGHTTRMRDRCIDDDPETWPFSQADAFRGTPEEHDALLVAYTKYLLLGGGA